MITELDIEETQRVIQYGIVCFVENGKRFYYKPRKLTIEESKQATIEGNPAIEYELIPLTLAEKVKYKLGIEESELKEQVVSDDGYDIEESEQDDNTLSVEEKLKRVREWEKKEEEKKTHKVDMNDPESVKNAKDIFR
jgi:hypothetical protein